MFSVLTVIGVVLSASLRLAPLAEHCRETLELTSEIKDKKLLDGLKSSLMVKCAPLECSTGVIIEPKNITFNKKLSIKKRTREKFACEAGLVLPFRKYIPKDHTNRGTS